jgi:hypothetical protein
MDNANGNYLSEEEVNSVKGLMHYLNTNMVPSKGVGVDVHLTDTNGESLGRIAWEPTYSGDGQFVLKFPS